jgi:predicted nucleotide-binding protein (sugar kinase/HSP70/actin superfamily)
MFNSIAIREKYKGDAQKVFDEYINKGILAINSTNPNLLFDFLRQAVSAFNHIPADTHYYAQIGMIGEIYLKYNNYGQSHISDWLRANEMEVVSPPLLDFITQYFVNSATNSKHGIKPESLLTKLFTKPALYMFIRSIEKKCKEIMKEFRFVPQHESIYKKAKYASEIIDLTNQFGEGWAIAAEVSYYARHNINKIVCIQPFGCIANHIVAKGIEKRLKKFYPKMSLLYLDFDGGAAEVNIQNRLHFMLEDKKG